MCNYLKKGTPNCSKEFIRRKFACTILNKNSFNLLFFLGSVFSIIKNPVD